MDTNKIIDFTLLDLPIPEFILKFPFDKQEDIYNYLKQMDTIHKKAYLIALDHLGTSFSIYKSNGYKEWKNKK